jgi:hypothetical protein
VTETYTHLPSSPRSGGPLPEEGIKGGERPRASSSTWTPSTLGSLKVAGLQASFVPSNGGAGGPGATYLGALTLHTGYLEVNGTFTGNSITEDPATIPWPYPIDK